MPALENTKPVTRWVTRIIPFILAAIVGFATYVMVVWACLNYLITDQHKLGAAIAILVLYFVFLVLMISTYARTWYNARFNPGLVPLGPRAIERRKEEQKSRRRNAENDLEAHAYEAGPSRNPETPGLEDFYSRDVFVCESDGRPKWCSQCANWKRDRVHHSRDVGRCIYKMDHFCPWVGGMIGENSFKFFVQFNVYTTLYCSLVIAVTAYVLQKQTDIGAGDTCAKVLIVVATFFGLFAFGMTTTSMRYILRNMTNVDMLSSKQRYYQLAVRVPRGTRSERFGVVVYPPGRTEYNTNDRRRRSNLTSLGTHTPPGAQTPEEPLPDTLPATTPHDLALRTFAILKTDPGENPWDLGPWRNFQSVMGTTPLDWLLPIRPSPCTNHESHESIYPMDRMLDQLRSRYGLPPGPPSDESVVMEMRDLRA